ncbi:hypothetical protein P154DRAFT_520470 [Amniculicola lignicola CBS 123094]|uniref:NAD(P)-binding protein n=1 Tax=Amniculicola lignicola CBS 123094 TaxID=1392246 RepID=A0A6A5WQD4_9PLEO|nr:hypothetical protein P154DRAFT_520470 [Amniculicola lignicola CBS 123094]
MENILSASENSGTVKRVVVTQAGAGFVNPDDGFLDNKMDKVINEHTPINTKVAAFRPPLLSPHHAYCGAKAYCMSFLNSLKSRSPPLPFSIVQVIPGTVIGPSELHTTPHEAKASMDRMSQALLFNTPKAQYCFGFVHVEDCAKVHVEALDEVSVPDVDIPEWFIAGGTGEDGKGIEELWREVGEMVEREFEHEVGEGLFTVGRENWPVNMPYRVENEMTRRMVLGGGKFKSLVECVRDVAGWYKQLDQVEKENK